MSMKNTVLYTEFKLLSLYTQWQDYSILKFSLPLMNSYRHWSKVAALYFQCDTNLGYLMYFNADYATSLTPWRFNSTPLFVYHG